MSRPSEYTANSSTSSGSTSIVRVPAIPAIPVRFNWDNKFVADLLVFVLKIIFWLIEAFIRSQRGR
jgi:hypothetical protein